MLPITSLRSTRDHTPPLESTCSRRMQALIFDEAVSGLDDVAMEKIAQTANELKGKVTILFITHKVPKSLKVDAHLLLGK